MRSLIFGVTGQDGAYLAKSLLEKGHTVFGASRNTNSVAANLVRLGIEAQVILLDCASSDLRSVLSVLKRSEPDSVYNLAGQTSVGLSFEQPLETLASISFSVANILEAIRLENRDIRFYNASSSEAFGNTDKRGATEKTAFEPRSPYGVAKAAAHWMVANYRESYGLFAVSGILFNHESPLRPARFVTAKIIAEAARIAAGESQRLVLGSTGIWRDWGWAPDYVEAMYLMMAADQPADYVIATGVVSRLTDFVEHAFAYHGLDWRDWVVHREDLARPSEIDFSRGDASLALERLGWSATTLMPGLVEKLSRAAERQTPF